MYTGGIYQHILQGSIKCFRVMQCLHKILASITYNSINKVNANIKYGKLHRALWGNPHPLQTTYVTRSDKTSLIATKYTYSIYHTHHLFCGCYLYSVSFIEFHVLHI